MSTKSTSVSDRESAEKICAGGYLFYLYFSSFWNVMDFLMIISGFIYLVLEHYTTLDVYTLQDMWFVAQQKQIAELFGSLTLILAFFRILDYLTMWEFLGILIITIFKMLLDIAKFLIVFVIIVTGFSAAFHLSYSGTATDSYSSFGSATLLTFLTTPTGYQIPESGTNTLGFAGPIFGLISQVVYVFVGIILLLNLLIALMSETYEFMREQATVEYRWLLAQPFKTGFIFLWPSPFCVVHVIVLLLYVIWMILTSCCCRPSVRYSLYQQSKENIPKGLRVTCQNLFKGMVIQYFQTEEDKEDFENCLVNDLDSICEKEPDDKGKKKE